MKHWYAKHIDECTTATAELIRVHHDYLPELAWAVSKVQVPIGHRSMGHGSELLAEIVSDADREMVTLELVAVSTGPMTPTQLENWYKRFGFFNYNGLHMVRFPARYEAILRACIANHPSQPIPGAGVVIHESWLREHEVSG